MRKMTFLLALILMMAAGTGAQVNVRGQFLLPGGDVPREVIQFYLYSGDGTVNEVRFSDSTGRFILERLSGRIDYTIRVTGDGVLYGDTSYSFNPGYNAPVRVTLNPVPRKPAGKAETVSAASGYQPIREAGKAHEAALKEISNKQFEAAETLLRKAVASDPKFVAAMIDLGAVLMQQKRYPEAEQVLLQAVETDKKSVLALLNLGITMNRQQKYADAIPHLREALRQSAGLVAAHLHLGIALVETEQFAEAETELLRASRTQGEEEIAAQLYLGKLYARTGEFRKGIQALEAYLVSAPNAANAGEVRALIARMQREMGKSN